MYFCKRNNKTLEIMAKPIKETPVLKNRDAVVFLREIAEPKRATRKELERIKRNFDKIQAIARF